MVSREANQVLSTIGAGAEHRWPEYASYCRSREQGLRSAAFRHLAAFIEAISGAAFRDRCEFVEWLCYRFLEHERAGSGLLPDPLLQRLIFPTLREWKDESLNLGGPVPLVGRTDIRSRISGYALRAARSDFRFAGVLGARY